MQTYSMKVRLCIYGYVCVYICCCCCWNDSQQQLQSGNTSPPVDRQTSSDKASQQVLPTSFRWPNLEEEQKENKTNQKGHPAPELSAETFFRRAPNQPTKQDGPKTTNKAEGPRHRGTDGNRAGNKKTAAEAKTQRGQRKNSTQTPKKRKQPTKQAKKQKGKKNSGDKLWPETCRAPQAGHPSIARKQTKRGRENEKKKLQDRITPHEKLSDVSEIYKLCEMSRGR